MKRTGLFVVALLIGLPYIGWAEVGSPGVGRIVPMQEEATLKISPATEVEMIEKELLTLELEVEADNAEEYEFHYSPVVENTSINTQTGVFQFQPNYEQAGTYAFEFNATDGVTDLVRSATVVVRDNTQAVLHVRPATEVTIVENELVELYLEIENPGEREYQFRVSPELENVEFDRESGDFLFHPDEYQAGEYTFIFAATDGVREINAEAQITVQEDNETRLIIDPHKHVSTLENEPITLFLDVENAPDSLPFTYSAENLPENAELDGENGILTFSPNYQQAGRYEIFLSATNGFETYEATARIDVENNNRLPELRLNFMGELSIKEGDFTEIQMSAFDPDQEDTLTYDVKPRLPNMSIQEGTGKVLFFPDYTQAGEYAVSFQVSDGHDTVSIERVIRVIDFNRLPKLVLNPPTGKVLDVGERFNLLATATDLDGDEVIIRANKVPPNGFFDEESGRFTFVPELDQYRDRYEVKFSADDGKDIVTKSIVLDVTAPISPIFEFNEDGNREGWIPSADVHSFQVEEGKFKGTVVDGNPYIYRPGLEIDTFEQHELVIRMLITNESPVEIYFLSEEEEFIGPAIVPVDSFYEHRTYQVDFSHLFETPKKIRALRIDPGDQLNYFEIDYVGFSRSPFERTPTPDPSWSPTPTPVRTPTRTPTTTPTPTATPSVTPTFDPNPPILEVDFDEMDDIEDEFLISAPEGYDLGVVFLADMVRTNLFSDSAMLVQAKPGEGVLLMSKRSVETNSPVMIKSSILSNSEWAYSAIVGFNSPIDGQLGYHWAGGGAIPSASETEMRLIYDPPNEAVQLGVQVTNPHEATETINVLFDRLRAENFPELEKTKVQVRPDGSFDKDLEDLLTNVNNDDGSVHVVWDSIARNWSIKLSVNPGETASNVGVRSRAAESFMPSYFIAEVTASRILGDGGDVALVMTNGRETVALFEDGDNFTFDGEERNLMIGGDFELPNPRLEPLIVVQNSGEESLTSINLDDLILWSVVPIYPEAEPPDG